MKADAKDQATIESLQRVIADATAELLRRQGSEPPKPAGPAAPPAVPPKGKAWAEMNLEEKVAFTAERYAGASLGGSWPAK